MNSSPTPEYWRKCNSCKSTIPFAQKYYVCSVSTCNRQRTGLVFCKVSCFDAHVPMMNHRDSGALEKRAPTLAEWQREEALAAPTQAGAAGAQSAHAQNDGVKRDILVVVSKTKDYVRAKAGFNTSESVMEALSDKVRAILDDAIRRAAQDDRKTIMDRDLR